MVPHTQDFKVAGIGFRIASPVPFKLPACFAPFLADDGGEADVMLTVTLSPPPKAGGEGWHSDSWLWRGGERIVRVEEGDARHVRLHIPRDLAPALRENANWLLYLAPERALLSCGRLVLHASSVLYRGRAFVFTAPSGGGKSTHASMWESALGAEVINGDKTVLGYVGDTLYAWGSPMAGTSGIWRDLSAPVAAVVRLSKAPANSADTLGMREAFLTLYSEAVKSDNDPQFNEELLTLVDKITKHAKMLGLYCLPDESAAEFLLSFTAGEPRGGHNEL